MANLVVALTGASGSIAARLLVEKSPWPVTLVVSRWGKTVFERECGPIQSITGLAAHTHENDDLEAPISSGSVPTAGMVILPCSCNTLGEIAAGIGSTLITRAAHCHLKERRPLVLCLRETPLSLIDLRNAVAVTEAGATVMPLSPPFYMLGGKPAGETTLTTVLDMYVNRILALLGHKMDRTWEDLR